MDDREGWREREMGRHDDDDDIIWQLQVHLDKAHYTEMLSSPDTLIVLLTGLASILEHSFGIHGFKSNWLCLIVKDLETWSKFLEPSGCRTVINYTFTFRRTTNVLVGFCDIMALIEPKALAYIAHSSVQLSNYAWSETMHLSAH